MQELNPDLTELNESIYIAAYTIETGCMPLLK